MVTLGLHAYVGCAGAAYCKPLPEWLQPWVVAGSVAIFVLTALWALWTTRRRH